jgi:hypothetical protein
MWIADEAYPEGRRLPMNPDEQAEVDAAALDEIAAALDALENPTPLEADAARAIAEAARLLRLGLDP